jgi:WD40 repeat protein
MEGIAISPDQKRLASSSHDETVALWDVATGSRLQLMKGHVGEVDSVTFTPDGKTLISGAKDTIIKFWDADTGKHLRDLTGHTGRIESMTISRDGKMLITGGGGGDTSVRIWDLSEMK